jgi:tetratricopeptide (TPR) repeat protein
VTTDDLYRWVKALHTYKLISKTSLDTLAGQFGGGEGSLGIVNFKDGQLIEHTHQGSGYNYEGLLYYNAAEDVAIILLTNNQNFKVYPLRDAILAILHGQPYSVPRKSIYLDLRTKVLDDFDKGIAFYYQIKANEQGKYDFSNEVSDLYSTGKYLMRRSRFDDAIKIFHLGTLADLKNAGGLSYAYSLIGDCYAKKGSKFMAILYYKEAVELDPGNKNASGMLNELLKNQ